ncbi:alpha/beta hydrolase [Actinacidiphila rubida]|uniref:Lysophospholipase, alpha-beta hydrolase superfamily n=1 Tax=Actinacidiphila rubida TaxID=310780 RepID=A0A1H8U2L9_9ACTN|nr:alpha/beta fold hydrolase [Actinacidiphila rubida]SEO96888.1 Lysophospholipase, alpha-beta hydrolase superfamily [Actinacidiphila rubida]
MNRTPVVFIHGAWLHALSWESWAERFASRGFLAFTPGWPGEPGTAGEVRASPESLADLGLDALTDHYADIVRSFDIAPVIIGHSVGGLIAQHLIGANVGRAAVAIAPAPVNAVPLPPSPARLWTPAADGPADPLVTLTPEVFRELFASTVAAEEADRLFERYVTPAPRRLLTDLGCAGAVRSPRAAADVANARRGPLLLISGQEDRLVPDAVTRAVYKEYGDSTAVTTLKQFADRAHSLVVDSGWRLVADHVLGWLTERGIRPLPEG